MTLIPGSVSIQWAGENLALLPERAVWWPGQKTLFIADPHFGKASAFRSAGIPVPETSHADDLERLESIIARHRAERLIILGDFFHAKSGRTRESLSALAEWRERQNDLNIVLVAGNHDLQAGPPPEEWRIEGVGEPWELPPFICCHRPRPSRDEFVLAGHLHPGFRLSERNRSGLTAVCFYFGARVAVLPAFGNFTGKALINAQKGEQVFVIAGTEVIDVSRLLP